MKEFAPLGTPLQKRISMQKSKQEVIEVAPLVNMTESLSSGTSPLNPCLFVLRFYGLVNPMGSVYLTTRLLGWLSPLSVLTSIVHILLPETDNCPP